MERLDKVYNEFLILNALKNEEKMSIVSIAAKNGISRPTVDAVIHQMEKSGIVIQDGYAKSYSGRKPVLWKLNGNSGFFVGIDLEPPVVRIIVLNICKEEIFADAVVFEKFEPDFVVEKLSRLIKDVFRVHLRAELDNLQSISIGNPGNIDNCHGISVSLHGCPDWENVPLTELLQDQFACPIFLENVTLFMANSERERAVRAGHKDYVYIALRTGVGAGICINGELFHGSKGNAGHFGFLPLSNPLFTEGRSLEECSDGVVILNRMKEYGLIGQDENKTVSMTTEYLNLFTDKVAENNEYARSILDEIADYWAYGISSTFCLLDIPLYIIGGTFSYINQRSPDVGNFFLEQIKKYCLSKYLPNKSPVFDLEFAKRINYAAALGGALFGYEKFFIKSNILLHEYMHRKI